jgi:protein phosphatase 2C family protein 2/3
MSAKGSDVKLRMSRSFGDFYLKQNTALSSERQAVIAVPEVKVIERSERDAFVLLACDGIFDVMTNQEVVDFVQQQIGFDGEKALNAKDFVR